MRYRKKPVLVEAWPIADLLKTAKASWRDLPEVVSRAYTAGSIVFRPEGIDVDTLEGWRFGHPADWLVSGIQGLYPIKPDVFAATYEVYGE